MRSAFFATVACGAVLAGITGCDSDGGPDATSSTPTEPASTVAVAPAAGGTPTPASASTLPDLVRVTCSADGIHVDARKIQTRPGGVVLVVTSTLPDGPYLTHYSSGNGGEGGGGNLPEGTRTSTHQFAPGVLTLGCEDEGDVIGGREVQVRVTDPGGYWRGFKALAELGCSAESGLNDWAIGYFKGGRTAVQAAQEVASQFSDFELKKGRPGRFAVREMPSGYVSDPSQVWVAFKDGEPFVTIQVRDRGLTFDGSAVAPCVPGPTAG